MASISVLANRTAIMSHYGECDIEAKELVSEIVPEELTSLSKTI